jgi:hypothetical protein
MRITLDKENDALYFRLDECRIVDSEECERRRKIIPFSTLTQQAFCSGCKTSQ